MKGQVCCSRNFFYTHLKVVLPVPKVKVSPSLSITSSSFRSRLPWVPCNLLTNVPYFERSIRLTHEGLAGALDRGSQATIFSTVISACTRDMDVSVCMISQPIERMPALIYNLAKQHSLSIQARSLHPHPPHPG